MDLKKFGIANFKSFSAGIQEIPIKPITLIFGPNSAGKSSLLQSFFYLEHAIATGHLNIIKPRRASAGMDLGGFKQTKNHQSGIDLISFSFRFFAESLEPSERHWLPAKRSYSLIIDVGMQSDFLGLKSVSLEVDDQEVLRARQQGDFLTITSLSTDHPALSKLIAVIEPRYQDASPDPYFDAISHDYDKSDLNAFLDHLITKNCYILESNGILPTSVRHIHDLELDDFAPDDQIRMSCFFSAWGDHLQDFQAQWLPDAFNPVIAALTKKLELAFAKLTHIPPLRDLPPRVFDLGQNPDSIWRRIATDFDVRDRINAWLSGNFMKSRYKLQVRTFLPLDEIENTLPGAMNREVRALLEKEEFTLELGEIVDRIREEYDQMDKVEYLRSNPELFETLIRNEIEETLDYEESLGDHRLSQMPKWRQREETIKKIEEICSAEDDFYPVLFEEYIWNHFRDHHLELEEHISNTWDPESAARAMTKRFQSEASQRRTEIVLSALPSNQKVSLQDVGVGISQILPVLMHSFGESHAMVAIEQPEIHIHPALQAELADVFIESALGRNKNTFLLETHSEHLILRLLRRIRETSNGDFSDWSDSLRAACPEGIRPDDVAVLYIDPCPDGSQIFELPIDAQGEFACDWPGGFFEERMKELF